MSQEIIKNKLNKHNDDARGSIKNFTIGNVYFKQELFFNNLLNNIKYNKFFGNYILINIG